MTAVLEKARAPGLEETWNKGQGYLISTDHLRAGEENIFLLRLANKKKWEALFVQNRRSQEIDLSAKGKHEGFDLMQWKDYPQKKGKRLHISSGQTLKIVYVRRNDSTGNYKTETDVIVAK